MAERSANRIVVVSADPRRRERAASALARFGQVHTGDVGASLAELSRGRPEVTIIDAALPREAVRDVLEAVGEWSGALLWCHGPEFEALDHGAPVQVVYAADDGALGARVARFNESVGRAAGGARRAGAAEAEGLLRVIRDVRHDLNNPLTAVMAEAELLGLDADELSAEQRESVAKIEEMAQRMREIVAQLREVN